MGVGWKHLLLDLWKCDPRTSDRADDVAKVVRRTLKAIGSTNLQSIYRRVPGLGVIGIATAEEGHVSVHTVVQAGYAAADILSCSEDFNLSEVVAALVSGLGASSWNVVEMSRGSSTEIEVVSVSKSSPPPLDGGIVGTTGGG